MPSTTTTQHGNTSNRFFALTPSRLEAVHQHDLSRAELLVWAAVEMGAKPRRPIAFSLEKLAENLHLVVETVRRAVRRLLSIGLLVGFFKGNRHHLAPASGAWEDSQPSPTAVSGCATSNVRGDHQATPTAVSPSEATTPTPVSGCLPEDADREPASALPPNISSPEDERKLDLSLCPVARQLVEDWNVYPKVAADLVERYGANHVGQVMAWGRWLKSKGKLRSLGWVYQALVRGWKVPDGFNKAQQPSNSRQNAAFSGGVSGANSVQASPESQQQQALKESTPESQLETVKQMLASPVPAVRRMGERFAAEWGVSLEAVRAV